LPLLAVRADSEPGTAIGSGPDTTRDGGLDDGGDEARSG
jgi:hypothetical protein